MSLRWEWRVAIRDHENLSSRARLLGHTLTMHMSDDGSDCKPGVLRLAREMGYESRATVFRAIEELRKAGLLKVIPRPGRQRLPEDRTNIYVPLLPASHGETPTASHGETLTDSSVASDLSQRRNPRLPASQGATQDGSSETEETEYVRTEVSEVAEAFRCSPRLAKAAVDRLEGLKASEDERRQVVSRLAPRVREGKVKPSEDVLREELERVRDPVQKAAFYQPSAGDPWHEYQSGPDLSPDELEASKTAGAEAFRRWRAGRGGSSAAPAGEVSEKAHRAEDELAPTPEEASAT